MTARAYHEYMASAQHRAYRRHYVPRLWWVAAFALALGCLIGAVGAAG